MNHRASFGADTTIISDSSGTSLTYKQLFGLTNRVSSYLKRECSEKPWLLCLPHDNLRTATLLSALSLNQPILEITLEKFDKIIDHLTKQDIDLTVIFPPSGQTSPLSTEQHAS